MSFDLDKVIAEQPKQPTRGKQFSFTFDGDEYKLPNVIDAIGLRAAQEGDLLAALQRALTAEQYATIKASSVMLTRAVLLELMNAYYEHLAGLTLGESPASSTRSNNTARPSKRTSKRTTASRSRR